MTVFVVLLLIALVAALVFMMRRKATSGSSCCGAKEAMEPKIKPKDRNRSHYPYHYEAQIEGMVCVNCARRVENTLDQMEGVWAKVDLGQGEAKVLSKKERGETDFRDILGPTDYSLTAFQEA